LRQAIYRIGDHASSQIVLWVDRVDIPELRLILAQVVQTVSAEMSTILLKAQAELKRKKRQENKKG